MEFDEGIRCDAQCRRNLCSMPRPSMAQHQRWYGGGIGSTSTTIVGRQLMFFLTLQQGTQYRTSILFATLKFELVGLRVGNDLQDQLIGFDRQKVDQTVIVPRIGDLMRVGTDGRKMIIVQAQQSGVPSPPIAEFGDLKLKQRTFATDQGVFVPLGHGRGGFESEIGRIWIILKQPFQFLHWSFQFL